MLDTYMSATKEKGALIHSITNYVTINDVANVLLACGARPIMAEDIHEVEEITTISDGLYLNIGMLTETSVAAMRKAGKKAAELGHTLVLDPVGAGASAFRTETTLSLLQEIPFTVIRGNVSELKAIALGTKTRGVDSNEDDLVTAASLDEICHFTQVLSQRLGAIIVATGVVDVVSDATRSYLIHNGHSKMRDVTGTGCQLSAMVCAYVASNPDHAFEATAAAVCAMGLAGEIAFDHLQVGEGNATYRNRIIDAIDCLQAHTFRQGANYTLRVTKA